MGDTGPCGPCTEIYIDRTPDKSGGPPSTATTLASWKSGTSFSSNTTATPPASSPPLPAQHVDTGMGLERLCQIIQNKDDNYATDLWTPLFDKISEISKLKYTGKFPKTNAPDPVAEAADPQLRHDIAFRVIADHVRCLTFALTDGATPSNEGRGYVLRRILRRAVFWGWQHLKIVEPFLCKLVPVIVDSMGGAFPELKKNPQHVADLIRDEEISFSQTIDRGIELFEYNFTVILSNLAFKPKYKSQGAIVRLVVPNAIMIIDKQHKPLSSSILISDISPAWIAKYFNDARS